MSDAITKVEEAFAVLGRDPWSSDEKVSDEFLPTVFKHYFEYLKTDDRMKKADFHILADFLEPLEVDHELVEALDLISAQAARATPRSY
jgi:hypothetical protein